MAEIKANTKAALEQLEIQVQTFIQPMGYSVVALEQTTGPNRSGRTLTLYIDFADSNSSRVGLDDCMKVNQAVDEFFETTPLLEGAYTLEVSSPGVERPLRKAGDYDRFTGHKARLHTFRALNAIETGNESYWKKNQRQKNFVGILKGLNTDQNKVQMEIDGNLVAVPLETISKANLEYVDPSSERERK